MIDVKAMFYSIGLIILFVVLIASFFYIEAFKFSSPNFAEDKLFLLEENNEFIAGMKIKYIEDGSFNESNYLFEQVLKNKSDLYKNKEYDKILEDNYQLFIFKSDINTSFAAFLEENLKDNGYFFILKGVRDKTIDPYPESFLFKIAKIIPFGMLDKIKKRFLNE